MPSYTYLHACMCAWKEGSDRWVASEALCMCVCLSVRIYIYLFIHTYVCMYIQL